jgi:hypothetical protein
MSDPTLSTISCLLRAVLSPILTPVLWATWDRTNRTMLMGKRRCSLFASGNPNTAPLTETKVPSCGSESTPFQEPSTPLVDWIANVILSAWNLPYANHGAAAQVLSLSAESHVRLLPCSSSHVRRRHPCLCRPQGLTSLARVAPYTPCVQHSVDAGGIAL